MRNLDHEHNEPDVLDFVDDSIAHEILLATQ